MSEEPREPWRYGLAAAVIALLLIAPLVAIWVLGGL